jgi:S-DNA-T family DNA segregation ATPase FtsK/SpoIIIE
MRERLKHQCDVIEEVLRTHRIAARVTGGTVRPRWVRFNVLPAVGARTTKIKRLSEELAVALGADDCRVKRRGAAVDVEIPRDYDGPAVRLLPLQKQLRQLEGNGTWRVPPATATLGLDEEGAPLLIRLPAPDVSPVLISGMSGTGKSTLLRTMALSLVLNNAPREVALVLIDVSGGETWSDFEGLPHVARRTVRSGIDAGDILQALTELRDTPGTPHIVVLLDGLHNLLALDACAREPLKHVLREGNAFGIHTIVATQRLTYPILKLMLDLDVTFGTRLVGRMTNLQTAHVASGRRGTGAERLREGGDFIAVVEGKVIRFQAAHVTPEEIRDEVAQLSDGAPPPATERESEVERGHRYAEWLPGGDVLKSSCSDYRHGNARERH